MSARRSRQAALCLFGRRGCEATPLSAIAADAGIRTPSIHAHFRGKEDLFRHLFDEAVAGELLVLKTTPAPQANVPEGLPLS